MPGTKRCSRSSPRCSSCPVVALRLARVEASGLTGKALQQARKRARKA